MRIGGFQSFTLIDYPGKRACIVFTQGCNFRCPYCHNPDLVLPECFGPTISQEEILSFLEKRKNKLEAVVITGGEPTLQKGLGSFIERVKERGFLVKLDTNGYEPGVIKRLLERGLVDYIAMDIKAPLERYEEITRSRLDVDRLRESIEIIKNSSVDYEFRTTVVRDLLSKEDLLRIGLLIKGAKRYYLQRFYPKNTLDPDFTKKSTYREEELKGLAEELKEYVNECFVR